MAGTSLIALLDDIASVLDDIALLTKVATKKTAGVLGDDLALNAEQVSGVRAERELPVVWAVAKGSAVNKVILVPAAIAISWIAPWLITPLLMVGGGYLCFEGFEKIVHLLFPHADEADQAARIERMSNPDIDLVALEKDKIKGAVRTDFVLSAEIVTIALGTVADANFGTRVAVMVSIAVVMTVGVYGLVAGIVKLDDLGLHLTRKRADGQAREGLGPLIGRGILRGAPWLMKGLSIAGTVAMFLVGGGIVAHGIPVLHHLEDAVAEQLVARPVLHGLVPTLMSGVMGLLTGALLLGAVSLLKRLRGTQAKH